MLGQSVPCPKCGNVFTVVAHEAIAPGEASPVYQKEDPHASSAPAGNEQSAQASGDHPGWGCLGVLAILVCGAMALVVQDGSGPWWLVVLLVPATPALIRMLRDRKKNGPGAASNRAVMVGTFLRLLGKTVTIGLASFIAFVVPFLVFLFFALMLGGIVFSPFSQRSTPPAIWVYPCGGIAGLPALLVAVWLFRKFFAKKG